MGLNKNIYNLRKERGFSQEYMAEKINVSRLTISNWELGETSPNPEQLLLLSKTLETSVDIAAPATPISHPKISTAFPMMFSTLEMIDICIGNLEFPPAR